MNNPAYSLILYIVINLPSMGYAYGRFSGTVKNVRFCDFLDHSRGFLEYSEVFLDKSEDLLDHCEDLLDSSRGFLDHSRSFLDHSTGFLEYSTGFLEYSGGFLDHSRGFLDKENHVPGYAAAAAARLLGTTTNAWPMENRKTMSTTIQVNTGRISPVGNRGDRQREIGCECLTLIL